MVCIADLQIGDRIKIVDHFDPDHDRSDHLGNMAHWLGKIVTVRGFRGIGANGQFCLIEEDTGCTEPRREGGWFWYPEMIECIVDDDISPSDQSLDDLLS